MGITRDIIQGFKAEVGGRILYFGTTGVVLIFLARVLSPSAYGIIFLAFSLLSVGQLFGDLAIPTSAARYITEYEELEPAQVGFIVTFSFVAVLVAASLVSLLLALFHRQIAALFNEPELGDVLLVGGGMILCRALYRYFRRILQGFKLLKSSAAVYSMEGVGRLVFVVVFVLLGFGTVGAIGGYALGYASAAILGFVLFYWYVYPDLTLTLRGGRKVRNRILRYAIPLLGIRGARMVDNSFDTVLVGFFLAPAMVGFYSLSKQAIHLLQAPASALGFSAGPWFGDQKAMGNVDRIADIYASSVVYTLVLYLPVAAGVALLAQPTLLIVFGEDFLPATEVLQIFSVLAVLQALEELTENAIDFLGRARERSIAKAITVTISLGGMIVLIPILDIVGAAIAKVLTHTLYVGILLYIMYTEVYFDAWTISRNVALILVVTGVMSVAVFYAAQFIVGIVTLVGVVFIGTAIWATLIVAFGIVDVQTVKSHLT